MHFGKYSSVKYLCRQCDKVKVDALQFVEKDEEGKKKWGNEFLLTLLQI